MFRRVFIAFAVLSLMLLLPFPGSRAADGKKKDVKYYKVEVIGSYPHDASAYTQGLFFDNGILYESSGQYGESSLRRVDLNTGSTLLRVDPGSAVFAEGSVSMDGLVYLLSWREQTCFVYDIETFNLLSSFSYYGEGWGLTTDGKSLIMSDGSSTLVYRDPMTFVERRRVTVTFDGKPVPYLNELEYIDGKIWANVYGLDYIIIIDGESGVVEGRIDCRDLLEKRYRGKGEDVLNGIAYNPVDGSVYLTGKYWPRMYKVRLNDVK